MADVWEEVEALLSDLDGDLRVEVGSKAMWSATLRLTTRDVPGEAVRSVAFYAVAGVLPDVVAGNALAAAREWLAGGGQALRAGYWLS